MVSTTSTPQAAAFVPQTFAPRTSTQIIPGPQPAADGFVPSTSPAASTDASRTVGEGLGNGFHALSQPSSAAGSRTFWRSEAGWRPRIGRKKRSNAITTNTSAAKKPGLFGRLLARVRTQRA